MTINELQEFMAAYGISIRAIPMQVKVVCEARHLKEFPNGRLEYMPEYKRKMCVSYHTPGNAGKFIIEKKCGTNSIVRFQPKQYYDSIEDAVNAVKEELDHD